MDKILKIQSEEWKSIKDDKVSSNYSVSNMGRIKNTKTGKLLKTHITNCGYERVMFGNATRQHIHRIVAKHFCKGFKDNLIVNHKDGNRINNKSENLEWTTMSENIKHGYWVLKTRPALKITKEIANNVRNIYKVEGKTYKELASMFKVCPSTIMNIINFNSLTY